VSLSLLTSMKDWGQQLGIEASQASKIFGIDPVFLTGIVMDQAQFSSIGNDDLMAQILQGLADPASVRSYLHGNAAGSEVGELANESIPGGGNAAFFDHFSILIENIEI